VTADTAFAEVIRQCGEATPDRPESWINPQIEAACLALHQRGHAHSVECWIPEREGANGAGGWRLVGGLYGISLGRAFFGESMFSRATDASKVALAWLVARLRVGGFTLLDCQFMTDHLASLGALEISQKRYLSLLGAAVEGVGLGLDGGGELVVSGGGSAAFDALDGLPGLVSPLGEPTVAGPVSGQVIAQLLTQTS
jgi:leucyl/phenylalanyl-tRNA--protein transferase